MMNSYRQNRHRSLAGPFVGVVLIVMAVFALDAFTGGSVRSYARTIGAGFASMLDDASGAVAEDFFSTRAQLRAENQELREQLSRERELLAAYSLLARENGTLKEMARLAEDDIGITAPVVSSFRSSPYGTFIIGAGEDSGVSTGAMVLTPGGFVLGVVSDAGPRSATVEAIFSPDAEFEAAVGDVTFLARGRGGGNARAQISRDVPVMVGDAVRAPAYGSRPVGIIGSIDAASSSAVSTIYMRVPLNLASLSYVYVIPLR